MGAGSSTDSTRVSQAPSEAVSSRSAFLPEVQALRALAVLFVVLFHLWPKQVTGGYIGVDVFFVISGFLISSHLLKEVAETGGVRLVRFWARRVRRLLPAAFLTLAVTLACVFLFVPTDLWKPSLKEVAGSALYVQNWVLARASVDYFAEDNAATAVQHYWSLAVEEQFYVIWPVLVLLTVLLLRRASIRVRTSGLAAGMAVVFAGSLAYSIHIAHSSQAAGYFSTFSHAWEFAAGGLLAMAYPRIATFVLAQGGAWRAATSWVGWGVLVYSGLVFDGSTLFPGSAALLPTLGVVLVIAAGQTAVPWGPGALVLARPV
ncbi:acyltransferase [Nakamurella silvestris]|nr:acyltransferase [Nakamurella silvestris]